MILLHMISHTCTQKSITDLQDCHMMVADPARWIEDIAKAGGQMYCFHLEATNDPLSVIEKIHKAGMQAGVAIKPDTPAEAVMGPVAEAADMILVMSVEPGFGGQKFMPQCMPKVIKERREVRLIETHIIDVGGDIAQKVSSQGYRSRWWCIHVYH